MLHSISKRQIARANDPEHVFLDTPLMQTNSDVDGDVRVGFSIQGGHSL